jgi:hypothetical protein
MIWLYGIIALLAAFLFALLKWRGVSVGRSVGFSVSLFLALSALITLVLLLGGDKPTPGAQTIRHEDLQR